MVKLLKQIAVFCVFTAAIWGVFILVAKGKAPVDLISQLPPNVDAISAQIDDEWATLNDWDEETYRTEMTMVAQSYSLDVINESAKKSLTDHVNSCATSKAVKAINRELDYANPDDKKLENNYNGLNIISSHNAGYASLPHVKAAIARYDLYRNICSFNDRNLTLIPKFDGQTNSWSPNFEAFAKGVRNRRDALLSDALYPKVSHINRVKEIYRTNEKLEDSFNKFYSKLGDRIVDYYESQIKTVPQTNEIIDKTSEEYVNLRTNFQALRTNVFNATYGHHNINANLREAFNQLFNQ